MTTIGFLHTAEVHVPAFRGLLAELAPSCDDLHTVEPELLADARRSGMTPPLAARIDRRLGELAARGADVIVCTCSSIGGYAEGRTDLGVPVVRIDRPMARAALAAGPRIAVVATVSSAMATARELLDSPDLTEVLCAEAWPLFEAGDLGGYAREVATRARQAAPGVDVIMLAQASLAPAAALLADLSIPVLTSPRLAVLEALRLSAR